MRLRYLALAAALLAIGTGWYFFRPERLVLDTVVQEPLPPAVSALTATRPPVLLARGRFHPVNHDGRGEVALYRASNGERILRFSRFATDNGPDLYVYLVAAADVPDDETVERAGYVSLGRLKGNVGDQNYTVPVGLDVSRYRTVVVWCQRFGVSFAAAPLGAVAG